MGRGAIAVIVGVGGFLAYLLLVLELAEVVGGVHWALDLLYFAVAGIVWAFPAARLLRWALEGRQGS